MDDDGESINGTPELSQDTFDEEVIPDAGSQGAPPLRARAASPASSSGSLVEHLVDSERRVAEVACPEACMRDYETVPEELRNITVSPYRFPLDILDDDFGILQPRPDRLSTMDAVGKTLCMLQQADESHFVQPTEGQSLCFVATCDGVCIPPHAQRVLFFFYRLLAFLKTHYMSQYVVPAPNIRLVYPRDSRKEVRGLQEVKKLPEAPEEERERSGERCFRLDLALSKRSRFGDTSLVLDMQPFTITVAFTGVMILDGANTKQELVCVVTIRPARTFDIVSYIKDVFLQKKSSMSIDKQTDIDGLEFFWKQILQYEANTNCGLMADPYEQLSNSFGELGVHTLTNLLSVPLRIFNVMQTRYPKHSNVKIIGCPNFTFRDDQYMQSYVDYMHAFLNHGAKIQEELRAGIKAYFSAKESEQVLQEYSLPCHGGWPARVVRDEATDEETYTAFSTFVFPITMKFQISREMPQQINFDSFLMNVGSLPELATKKMRDFMTTDWGNPGNCIEDARVLQGTELATPQRRTERYYGQDVNPVEDLITVGKMTPWYNATMDDIQIKRAEGGITPETAVDLLWRHLHSCMEHHSGLMAAGYYNSVHLEQCNDMSTMLPKSPLGEVSLKDFVDRLRQTKVDSNIRHDPYLSVCSVFYLALVDLNKNFALNAANLECLLEMWMSSIHHLVGSHDPSIVDFFQGIIVASARGHLQVHAGNGEVGMDMRKPNTSGAGTIQDRANKIEDWLCAKMGISPAKSHMGWIAQQRCTDGAMEDTCCFTVMNNQVVNRPPKSLQDRPVVCFEGRNHDYTGMIRWGAKRDGNMLKNNRALTTMDPNHDNNRRTGEKYQATQPNFCGFSTNCVSKDAEEPTTMAAVQHVLAPGAPRYRRIENKENRCPNDVHCDINDVRARAPDEEPRFSLLIKLFGFTRHWVKSKVAVPHRSGMLPIMITPQVGAYLDWLFMFIKEHVLCIFDERVAQSFGRMKQGYESRHVAGAMWMQGILAFTASEKNPVQAALDTAVACRLNPIPVSEAGAVAFSVLYRGLHTGLLSVASCLLQALHVPIIPLDHLREFFSTDQVQYIGEPPDGR